MSRLEEDFALQLRAYHIKFEREVRVCKERRYRLDFVLPGKLAVEVNGGTWVKSGHSTGTGIQRDCDKAYEALKAGFRLLPLTGDDIRSGAGIDKVLSLL